MPGDKMDAAASPYIGPKGPSMNGKLLRDWFTVLLTGEV